MLRRIILASVGAIALAGTAFAADLPSRAPPPVYLPPPVFTWSGIYIGLTAGFAEGYHNITDLDSIDTNSTTPSSTALFKSHGFIGGGTLGINIQQGNFVYGLVTDFSGLTNSSSFHQGQINDIDIPLVYSNRINYLGTVRGRLGLAVDRTLFYFTAGFAYAGIHNSWGRPFAQDPADIDDQFLFSAGNTRFGWVVGGGLEYALTPNWTIKGEALYADLGSTTASHTHDPTDDPEETGPFHTRFNNTVVVIRAGVNYKFSLWTPGPVVAAY